MCCRVGNFRQKKFSAEDGTIGEFRLFRGTQKSQNSVPNHSEEEKNVRNFVPWKMKKHSWNFVPNNSAEEKTAPFRGTKIKVNFPEQNRKE